MAGFFILMMTIYWGVIATDRYVSESSIVLDSPQINSPSLNFQTLLTGGGSAARSDMLLLRDYMLSVDMLKKLDKELDIRNHYNSSEIDWFSRLKDKRNSIEELHEYYIKRVTVDFDDYSQLLRIKVEAFNPEMAFEVGTFLINEGEAHMNKMGQRLATEQVDFLEKQVKVLRKGFDENLAKLIDFQNESGLVSAEGEIESVGSLIASLHGQLASLTAQRTAALTYQSSSSAEIIRLQAEIEALNDEINEQRASLAKKSGGALNVLSSEYQILDMNVQFSRESYSSALAALQSTRIEAARQLKQVSIIQSPTQPEYAVEPRRIYSIIVIIIITMLIALILQMVVMIIRDHQD
ncbi:chain-length determining protein [Amphritea atlantica]|nr:chain-length determining protein [Amphritea atlantica]